MIYVLIAISFHKFAMTLQTLQGGLVKGSHKCTKQERHEFTKLES
ncbi:hypothetical protein [Helicobacter canis]|nr:hypothetical protein [Helicobacter canis]